jgi:hypothetical protein
MLDQLSIGGAVSACNIAIHALVMALVVRAAQATSRKWLAQSSLQLAGIMIATVLILMAAHTSEVMVWALAYRIVNATSADTGFVYFAFVNYTTLGYGDVVPLPNWQLLGPITAMNGILLFGWSTAVIFEVLRRTMGR